MCISRSCCISSKYVKNLWKQFGGKNLKSSIIYNAVDLREFYPIGKSNKNSNFRIIAVEGEVQGELALNTLISISSFRIDVYGNINKKLQNTLLLNKVKRYLRVQYPEKKFQKSFLEKKFIYA